MSETFRTSIDIAAAPERVFDHFVKPDLLVRWMGDFARLEAVDGGGDPGPDPWKASPPGQGGAG